MYANFSLDMSILFSHLHSLYYTMMYYLTMKKGKFAHIHAMKVQWGSGG